MDITLKTLALREERMKAYNELNTKLEETSGRVRSEEEKAVITRMDAHIDELDEQIALCVKQERRYQENDQLQEIQRKAFGDLRKSERPDESDRDQFRNWVRSGGRGEYEIDFWAAKRERDLLRSGASPDEIRVLNYQTSSGSLVVPTTMARDIYGYLEAQIAGFRIGATIVNTATGEPMQFPKVLAHSIASGTIPQGTALGGTDPTFSRVQLDTYKYSQLVAVSTEMVSDSAFDITAWLTADVARGIGRQVDTFLIAGTGSSQPNGMTKLAGSGTNAPITTGGSLIAPSYEKYVDLVYSVNDAYRAEGAAWLTKDSNVAVMRKLRDGAGGTIGAPMWEPSLTAGLLNGQPDRFLGYPVYSDPNCAAAGSDATLHTFGWFGEYVIRTVGNPVIERDDSVYFATDQVAYRGKWRVDGDHLDVSALNNLVQNV
jgi:HK97 family phage major capsid protein